uniref:Ubiquinol-cytochrome c reductase, cytochrome c1 n=1 Tax=mine drainage metagenome TaxID=410659 RepID=E6QUE7_9ZZZZ
MKTLKRISFTIFTGLFFVTFGASADDAYPLQNPQYTMNRATVIRGAKLFADNCMACHSVSSIRYDRLTRDLGMPEADVKKEIMLPDKADYLMGMSSTMQPALAIKMFGYVPPDLSHMERYKGANWIYTYLLSFYRDPSRPSGWNNHVFPNVAMPDVLAPWGGIVNAHGQVIQKGSMSLAKFQNQAADIVAFLRYTADPSVFERWAFGLWVLGGLLVFTILAYFLKKEYWKDVHRASDGSS